MPQLYLRILVFFFCMQNIHKKWFKLGIRLPNIVQISVEWISCGNHQCWWEIAKLVYFRNLWIFMHLLLRNGLEVATYCMNSMKLVFLLHSL